MLTDQDDRERLAAACWALGGTIWVVHVLVLHARPQGCIAAACSAPGTSVRPTEDLLWLFLVAVGVLAVGMALAPSGGPRGRAAWTIATWLVLAGAAALSLGLVVNAALPGDSPLWWLHDSDSMGRLLPVLGSGAAGLAAWRGQGLGRWQGALLAAASLASLGFNAQTDRILFTLPLGAAWAVVGAMCWLAPREAAPRGRSRESMGP